MISITFAKADEIGICNSEECSGVFKILKESRADFVLFNVGLSTLDEYKSEFLMTSSIASSETQSRIGTSGYEVEEKSVTDVTEKLKMILNWQFSAVYIWSLLLCGCIIYFNSKITVSKYLWYFLRIFLEQVLSMPLRSFCLILLTSVMLAHFFIRSTILSTLSTGMVATKMPMFINNIRDLAHSERLPMFHLLDRNYEMFKHARGGYMKSIWDRTSPERLLNDADSRGAINRVVQYGYAYLVVERFLKFGEVTLCYDKVVNEKSLISDLYISNGYFMSDPQIFFIRKNSTHFQRELTRRLEVASYAQLEFAVLKAMESSFVDILLESAPSNEQYLTRMCIENYKFKLQAHNTVRPVNLTYFIWLLIYSVIIIACAFSAKCFEFITNLKHKPRLIQSKIPLRLNNFIASKI